MAGWGPRGGEEGDRPTRVGPSGIESQKRGVGSQGGDRGRGDGGCGRTHTGGRGGGETRPGRSSRVDGA